jgi:hypothetical protein
MTWQAFLLPQLNNRSVEYFRRIGRVSWTLLHATDQDQNVLNRADCYRKDALTDVVWSCSAPGRLEWMADEGETCRRSLLRSRMGVEDERNVSVNR